jgi:uncharacterized membrane protein YjjP (DUF1212 family)
LQGITFENSQYQILFSYRQKKEKGIKYKYKNKNMNLRTRVNEIKSRLYNNEITYEDAKKELQPYIKEANEKGKRIARKHKTKFYDFTFNYLMR